jgi:hypothetical protein
LPIIAGSWLALLSGAWDYISWLTSPAVIAGSGVSLMAGIFLQRRGEIHGRQIALAIVVDGFGFALSLVVVFFAVLAAEGVELGAALADGARLV